jgi:hypothetical protein
MSHAPVESVWYLGELVLEIEVGTNGRNVVHRNLTLIRATSANDAYSKAIELGSESEVEYENPSGERVRIMFRGISKLNEIHDPLEHGAEILYEETIGVPEQTIKSLIPPKSSLAVFRPIEPTRGPDYSSKEVLEDANRIMKERED